MSVSVTMGPVSRLSAINSPDSQPRLAAKGHSRRRRNRPRSPRRSQVAALLMLVGTWLTVAPAWAAGTPAPATPAPAAVPGQTAPVAVVPGVRTATATPPNGAAGAQVTVTSTGWPAGATVGAIICGNNALNGATDCIATPAGQGVAGPDGAVAIPVIVAAPPQPCPCVVRLSVAGDPATADAALIIDGATTTPPVAALPQSSVDVDARIVGTGPLSAFVGGAAEREVVIAVTNTGAAPLVNPVLTLTFGKGQEPTEPLLGPGGQAPQLGTIAPGQSVEYRQPVTIDAPAFGQYRLLGTFQGITTVSVNGAVQSQPTFTATTTSYPWLLIVGGWLLLQIPLLGLYKRRPVIIEPAEEDPYQDAYGPVEASAAPVLAAVAAPASSVPPAPVPAPEVAPPPAPSPPAVPSSPAPPPPSGFQLVGAPGAAAAPPPGPPPVPPVDTAPEPQAVASPVFGVNDLRSMLDD